MVNCEIKSDRVTSVVNGVTVSFDAKELGEILRVPTEGYNNYKKLKLMPYSLETKLMPYPMCSFSQLCLLTSRFPSRNGMLAQAKITLEPTP